MLLRSCSKRNLIFYIEIYRAEEKNITKIGRVQSKIIHKTSTVWLVFCRKQLAQAK